MHYFVSDLHLFTERSNADMYEAAFNERASTGSTFVLGGDIFDFDWSTLPSVEATIDAAIDWLHRFVTSHPDCQFHYLLGNHDCLPSFVERLDELSASLSNLAWEPFYLRIGDVLMLHGDVANRHMDAAGLIAARATHHEPRRRPAYHHQLYKLAVQARLHKAISVAINPKRLVARRILSYLETVGHGVDSGLTDIYFGHTHVPMRQYYYQGVHFHNGGAAMRGLNFQILEVNLK
ncbi:metallophosphoesterase [Blastopirellula marina]|uniref:Calcineurin-like phosphoesterase domain-containing protein n=1 Tax=Blastopirellula marina TaxID=124 RepID=A0A2S8GIB4_9BACT|nr:metallophosphoesterase [Blastopirellula marina]PQO44080.1 hypothetical protein C5Y93_21325 [Blastopirellula marina]